MKLSHSRLAAYVYGGAALYEITLSILSLYKVRFYGKFEVSLNLDAGRGDLTAFVKWSMVKVFWWGGFCITLSHLLLWSARKSRLYYFPVNSLISRLRKASTRQTYSSYYFSPLATSYTETYSTTWLLRQVLLSLVVSFATWGCMALLRMKEDMGTVVWGIGITENQFLWLALRLDLTLRGSLAGIYRMY